MSNELILENRRYVSGSNSRWLKEEGDNNDFQQENFASCPKESASQSQVYEDVAQNAADQAPFNLIVSGCSEFGLRDKTIMLIQNQTSTSLPIKSINMEDPGQSRSSMITEGIFGDKQTWQSLEFNVVVPYLPNPASDK